MGFALSRVSKLELLKLPDSKPMPLLTAPFSQVIRTFLLIM